LEPEEEVLCTGSTALFEILPTYFDNAKEICKIKRWIFTIGNGTYKLF
jgi:hypothetical protein